jgi:hypothetical protein
MPTNLNCVGLGINDVEDLRSLVSDVLPNSTSLGVVGNVDVRRWEDASGVRLVFELDGSDLPDVLPSFAGPAAVEVAEVTSLSTYVVAADVIDEGEPTTRMAFELEERRF